MVANHKYTLPCDWGVGEGGDCNTLLLNKDPVTPSQLLCIYYLLALCLCLDVKGLYDQQLIEKLQDKVHASLLEYNNNFHPSEPNRFGNILLRLPELRSIGTKSLERLFMLSLTGQINASNSLSELLHSTKR